MWKPEEHSDGTNLPSSKKNRNCCLCFGIMLFIASSVVCGISIYEYLNLNVISKLGTITSVVVSTPASSGQGIGCEREVSLLTRSSGMEPTFYQVQLSYNYSYNGTIWMNTTERCFVQNYPVGYYYVGQNVSVFLNLAKNPFDVTIENTRVLYNDHWLLASIFTGLGAFIFLVCVLIGCYICFVNRKERGEENLGSHAVGIHPHKGDSSPSDPLLLTR